MVQVSLSSKKILIFAQWNRVYKTLVRIAGQENVGGDAFYSIFVTSFDLQRLVLCVGFSPNITPTRLELQPQRQRQNPAWACHDDQQEVVG